MESLIVYNIQNFSVHDGPGIRTTIFLKGCPLTCLWCHNPESQNFMPLIYTNKSKCIGCSLCLEICKFEDCQMCLKCIDVCPANARMIIGENITQEEIIDIVMKDVLFYEQSDGGVTFSGGEPLSQAKSLTPIIKALKQKGLHIAIDTSGYAEKSSIESLIGYVDLWLYDLKHINNDKHIKLTGKGNDIIISNLRYLVNSNQNIWIRFPLIPGCNDELENIEGISRLLNELSISKLYLLPYHNLAEDKHNRFEKEYLLQGLEEPSETDITKVVDMFNKHSIKVEIGG